MENGTVECVKDKNMWNKEEDDFIPALAIRGVPWVPRSECVGGVDLP